MSTKSPNFLCNASFSLLDKNVCQMQVCHFTSYIKMTNPHVFVYKRNKFISLANLVSNFISKVIDKLRAFIFS